MSKLAIFNEQAMGVIRTHIERLRGELNFETARALPAVTPDDVLIGGREVQLTIYRQADLPFLGGQILVTVQVARFGLGGVASYRADRGLVFSADVAVRDATEDELRQSASP